MDIKDKIKSWFTVPDEDYGEVDERMLEDNEPQDYSIEREEERSDFEDYRPFSGHRREREEPKVVGINDSYQKPAPVMLKKLRRYEDVEEVADLFKDNKIVVINTEECSETVCRNILYFLAGLVYALDGALDPVAGRAYILTPKNVPVSGKGVDDILSGEDIGIIE